MKFVVYVAIIVLYTFLPFCGLFVGDLIFDDLNTKGLILANAIHLAIFYTGVFFGLRRCQIKGYGWKGKSNMSSSEKIFRRIYKTCIICCVVQFCLYGADIFSGADRGLLRTQLGYFGWLVTFIGIYLTPGLLSLATVLFFYTHNESKEIYIKILVLGFIISLMAGGKANVVTMAFPVMLQISQMLNFKKGVLIIFLSAASIVLIGTRQMGMTIEESVIYNSYRATNLTAYGSACVWDKYPNGRDDAYIVILGSFGEGVLSALTGVDRHSVEFLKYSFTKQITYDYYNDADRALEGSTNLTLPLFCETVYWFGHRYFWILSLFFSWIIYKFTLYYFSSQSINQILRNTILTVYFSTVIVIWMNSTSGSIFTSLCSVYILFYMYLLYLCLKFVCKSNNYLYYAEY